MVNIEKKEVIKGWESPISIHPGVFLKDELEKNSMSQIELAQRSGISKKYINDIVLGKHSITPNIAFKLGRIFNKSDKYWINLQNIYNEDKSRIDEDKRFVEEIKKYFGNIYIREIYKELSTMGIIEKHIYKYINSKKIILSLQKFFGVYSLDNINQIQLNAVFRKYKRKKINPYALAAWIRLGQIKSSKVYIEKFNNSELRNNLDKIKKLSILEPEKYLLELENILAGCGVVLVCAPYIKNSHVQGATHWISSDKVMLIIKTTKQGEDKFWFNLFHEIAHILKCNTHGKTEMLINLDNDEIKHEKIELEADKFAEEILLPSFSEDFEYFKKTTDPIKCVADKNEISQAIVAGRLAYELKSERKVWALASRYINQINYINI